MQKVFNSDVKQIQAYMAYSSANFKDFISLGLEGIQL